MSEYICVKFQFHAREEKILVKLTHFLFQVVKKLKKETKQILLIICRGVQSEPRGRVQEDLLLQQPRRSEAAAEGPRHGQQEPAGVPQVALQRQGEEVNKMMSPIVQRYQTIL